MYMTFHIEMKTTIKETIIMKIAVGADAVGLLLKDEISTYIKLEQL